MSSMYDPFIPGGPEQDSKPTLLYRLREVNLYKHIPLWCGVFLVLAVILPAVTGTGSDMLFRRGSLMTYFSPLLLMICGIVAGIVYWERIRGRGGILDSLNTSRLIWLIVAIGFALLATDEMSNFHRSFGAWLRAAFEARGKPISPRFDDSLVWAYMAVAFLLALAYADELLNFRVVLPYLWTGAALMLLSLGLNIFVPDSFMLKYPEGGRLHILSVMSDVCKIEAEAFLLSALLRVRGRAASLPIPIKTIHSRARHA